ncbi:hypothetical protein B0O99DRAFT_473111, partial [Bisporella sp. PMI_857]
ITCQIIDVQTQKPAAGMQVLLRPLNQSGHVYSSNTDFNGQIRSWGFCGIEGLGHYLRKEMINGKCGWQIQFESGRYFGNNTSWPLIEVNFYAGASGNFHISIEIGKYSY